MYFLIGIGKIKHFEFEEHDSNPFKLCFRAGDALKACICRGRLVYVGPDFDLTLSLAD